MKAKGKTKET